MFSVEGKAALVTGGSRGLGLAIAQGLFFAGAKVAVAARTAPPVEGVHFVPCDLMNADARAGLIERVVADLGAIDVLVHCAGQQHRRPAAEYPLDTFEEIYQLHVVAGMDLCQQAARYMLPRGSGKIIFVSSVLGFQGGITVPAYSAAKHAVVGLVRALANEWAGRGVNVNAIAPGYMNTEMVAPLMNDPDRGPAILSRIPAGRLGEPGELVGAVIFLASAASSYVHGHTLVVDGGWLAR
ncbi:MAG: SDR family oxidoreductase [Chloroflexi bacterium]|uniref:2-deoxy-D-gluconate 3-dehydrogenase n=1 Tax=Candidatus Thermofonsia Clade 3 bacterium TaxID=2364212 RepID=A0A2M8QAD4_9CHLR|nr:MAG: 2-deoxy-D-gluconate 3-dehydrogenase [Candidatus Thermofonsia Clade 3 bacterium]RMG63845.1 MAG: SDR family oxidoreductase [Chloroflexota bacterium]